MGKVMVTVMLARAGMAMAKTWVTVEPLGGCLSQSVGKDGKKSKRQWGMEIMLLGCWGSTPEPHTHQRSALRVRHTRRSQGNRIILVSMSDSKTLLK